MSLNTCTISGNLGKAAELRYTNSQLAIVTFSVAVNERAKQADGSYQDVPHWFDCVMVRQACRSPATIPCKGHQACIGWAPSAEQMGEGRAAVFAR